MTECNECGDEVVHVWRHRSFESEAHRGVRWVCADCHPDLPDTLARSARAEEAGTATEDAETVVMTDGGKFACPDCAGATVNGAGLFACHDCGWTGPC